MNTYLSWSAKTFLNLSYASAYSRGNKLCPLEVKSSGYKAHASLDAFQEKYSARILHRYLIYTKDLARDQDVLMLPVFMVGLI